MALGRASSCSASSGTVRSSCPSRLSSASLLAPRAHAKRKASSSRAATWAVCVLVAATPISRPARVNSTWSASRVAWLPMMLVSASTGEPASRASRMAASVSAVSPDWVMPITRVSGSNTGSR